MSDRLNGVMVTFEMPYRDDDAEEIINAIKMVKGVAKVESVVRGTDAMMEESRIKQELQIKLYDFIKKEL
jgi:predicted component of type VI protein secretion system